jgi:hypothetical protein
VLHRNDRQIEADQLAYLARPRPRRIDHDVGEKVALARHDPPLAPPRALEPGHSCVPLDPRAPIARPFGQRMRHARRIDVPVVRVPHRPEEAARLDKRVEPADLLRSDDLEREPDRPRLAPVTPVLVHPVRHRREPEAPGPVEPHRLPRLRFQPRVEAGAGEVDPRDVQAGIEVWRVACRVPRRARGQLPALEQHHVGPSGAREVVQEARAHDAAADDDDPRGVRHGEALRRARSGSPRVNADPPSGWPRLRRGPGRDTRRRERPRAL